MEVIDWVISLGVTIATALGTIIMIASRFIKQLAEKQKIILNSEVFNNLVGLVAEAEEFLELTGEQKKAWVIEKSEEFAKTLGIEFDAEIVSQKIEALIDMTKIVNTEITPREQRMIENSDEPITQVDTSLSIVETLVEAIKETE